MAALHLFRRLVRARLAQFIVAEISAFGGGTALSLEVYAWVLRSPWMGGNCGG
jgi:hypothetical protein